MSAQGKPVEWDATAYDKLSDPQFLWGMKLMSSLPLRGDETVIVAFLSEDLFIKRGFATLEKGEKTERAKSVSVVLNIPSFNRADDCNLTIRFYRIEPGKNIEEINAGILRQLQTERRLSLQFEVTPKKLCAAICNSKADRNQ